MSTIDQLLAAVGVGSAQVELRLDAGVWPRGGELTGMLVLNGGVVAQNIESLTVRLEELVTQGKSSEWKRRGEQILGRRFATMPGQRSVLPFKLRIPEDARITTSKSMLTWRVAVEADILWALNPRADVRIDVAAHHEVTAVQRALERIGFATTNVYVDFALRESPDTVVTYYKAPPNVREQIDGASLHARVFGAFVHGRLILNRHQHSVGEHLLALVGADREEFPFQIPRDALLNPKGGPNGKGAAPALQDILSRALVLPSNVDQKTLLRAATGPPSEAMSLLRPASGSSTDDAGLLRPADGDGGDPGPGNGEPMAMMPQRTGE
jgi:sporulation-control protein